VLAEIDQDGFAFAVDPRDAPFFERRKRRAPRQLNQLDIVLLEGRVCVRKRYRSFRAGARDWGERPVPLLVRAKRRFWNSLGFYLYSEAAVLLRLSDVPFVPKLRAIDLVDRAIYVDYVNGQTLRECAAQSGAAVYDQDLAASHDLVGLSARELERREVTLLERAGGGGDFRREILEMVRGMNARGVAPLDIKLGNFIRGATTGRLYWIDFEFARVESQPHWDAALRLQRDTIDGLIGRGLRAGSVSGKAAEKVA
jgi:tRNA A-37 threonylcarbamoyl transferase component Bud32